MATYKLTPNQPDPLTGLTNSFIGWHFIEAEATDAIEGAKRLQGAGYYWDIHPDPDNVALIRMTITQPPTGGTIQVHESDWFTLDGQFVRVLLDLEVTTDYAVEIYVPPAPPDLAAPPPPPVAVSSPPVMRTPLPPGEGSRNMMTPPEG
jgi:hypothetical protein